MRKTAGKRRKWPIVLVVVLVAVLALGVVVFLNLPKPQQTCDGNLRLDTVADGVYTARVENGLVAVEVAVTVEGHAIKDIELLEHRNGMGQAAENILPEVVTQQSVEVDAVAGATLSSQTILKAVENALAGLS